MEDRLNFNEKLGSWLNAQRQIFESQNIQEALFEIIERVEEIGELTSEEKLLHAIFGEKTREVRDTSLRVDHGADGIVHDVQIYTKENSDESILFVVSQKLTKI
jgi:hypothetical protein